VRRLEAFGAWIAVAVASVAVLVLYVDNYRTRECFADYMSRDSQNTVNRAQIQDAERDKFLIMLKELMDPKNDAEARTQALDGYIAEVERNNVLREQNPVLPVPTECD